MYVLAITITIIMIRSKNSSHVKIRYLKLLGGRISVLTEFPSTAIKSRQTDFFLFKQKERAPLNIQNSPTVYYYAQTPAFLILHKNITRDCGRLYWHHEAIHLQTVTALLSMAIYFFKKRKIKNKAYWKLYWKWTLTGSEPWLAPCDDFFFFTSIHK